MVVDFFACYLSKFQHLAGTFCHTQTLKLGGMDDDDDDRSSKILAKCPPPCQRCPNANCTTSIVHMKCTLH